MNAAERVLERLDRVRPTGPDSWMAASPTRDERTPSVSIKQVDDRVLIHDFGGDDTESILAAVGLTLADLFDKPLEHNRPPMRQRKRRRQGQAADALRAIRHESFVVLLAADRLAAGFGINGEDMDRLHQAHQRILATININLPRPDHPLPSDSYLPALRTDLDKDRAAANRLEVRP